MFKKIISNLKSPLLLDRFFILVHPFWRLSVPHFFSKIKNSEITSKLVLSKMLLILK